MSSTTGVSTTASPSQHNKNSATSKSGLIAFIVFVLCGLAGLHFEAPPRPLLEPAQGEFSAERALKHLQVIANKPHPIGSAEHDVVRDYILQTLSSTGFSPEVQKTTAINKKYGIAATVENIMARLKGSEGGKAVVLVAHYDSVVTGPGASDDGAAVAAMLETARILKSSPQLKRDVIFLITDGEEMGLLGASAFVAENPWAKSAGTILNFEARGTHGPVIMFETSNQNGWLIENFKSAASNPAANSLSYEIYKRLPNDTDFSVFKAAGYSGLNFAFIDGLVGYHTYLDNIQDLDLGSLQHHGDYELELTKAFANSVSDDPRPANKLYFDVFGLWLVSYSQPVAVVFVILVAGLLVLAFYMGARSGEFTVRGAVIEFVVVLGAVIASVATTGAISWLISAFGGSVERIQAGRLYHPGLFVTALACFGLAAAAALLVLFRKILNSQNPGPGGLLAWFILLLVTTLYLPGGSYLFLWPLFFCLLGWILVLSFGGMRKASAGFWLVVSAMPAMLLLVPQIHKIFTAFAFGANLFVAALLPLLLALVLWQLRPNAMPSPWFLPGLLIAAGIVFFISGLAVSRFDVAHPRLDSILYVADADTGKYEWTSFDERPDAWTSQFLPGPVHKESLAKIFPGNSRMFLQSPAQPMAFAPPTLEVLADHVDSGQRQVKMQIKSGRRAPILSVLINSKTPVSNATVNGKPIELWLQKPDTWILQYYGVREEGINVAFSVQPSVPVRITVEDTSNDLAEQTAATFRPRPQAVIPSPNRFNNGIIVAKTFSF